jgi:predicted CoA-substrate-specific enzyme activase
MYTMGIDIGSSASKGVIMKDGKEIIANYLVNTGTGTSGPTRVYKGLIENSGLERSIISKIVATGYGRINFEAADYQISELSCHARGVSLYLPEVRTVIDIGGQDVKILRLDSEGKLFKFVMNDKCAAGTGRFLDVMSRVLEIEIDDFAEEASKSGKAIQISNTCTVFAESEVISHLAKGIAREDVCAGIENSVVKKVAGLTLRLGVEGEVAMTGGVANNYSIVKKLGAELLKEINVPKMPQYMGAIGAARFGYEKSIKSQQKLIV